MKRLLDLNAWERKEHFNFFKQFEEPFFGVCVTVDCTLAYTKAKEEGVSFFLYYLYKSLDAANKVEPFRYRILGDEVTVYDKVHASAVISRPNTTFGFSYINYQPTFEAFAEGAKAEIAQVQKSTGLFPAVSGQDVIHFSSIPWINFTSVSHARAYSINDSCPKISFGKMTEENGRRQMAVSIHVHHGLMDGYHVGQYIDLFQELLNS
ncbi:CatA-like O-acetyltransferase [Pontibacter sp. CAU 1760]